MNDMNNWVESYTDKSRIYFSKVKYKARKLNNLTLKSWVLLVAKHLKFVFF
jgi:ABC-type sulfate transport system substrate-binding protein